MSLHVLPGVAVAELGDVMLVSWSGPPRLATMRFVLDRAEAFVSTVAPGQVLVMQVIRPRSAERPEYRAFAEAGRRLVGLRSSMRRFVTVALGDEISVRVARTVMRTIAVAAGSQGEMVIEATVDGGLQRVLAAASARTPSFDELRRAIAALQPAAPTVRGAA